MNYNLTDPYEIARFIKDSKKTTPVKVYVNGDLSEASLENIEYYGNDNFYISLMYYQLIQNQLLLFHCFYKFAYLIYLELH